MPRIVNTSPQQPSTSRNMSPKKNKYKTVVEKEKVQIVPEGVIV